MVINQQKQYHRHNIPCSEYRYYKAINLNLRYLRKRWNDKKECFW